MKKKALITIISLLWMFVASAQKSRTFQIEKLEPIPVKYQPIASYQDILEGLIRQDNFGNLLDRSNTPPVYNIIAKSNIPEKLVTFKYSSFFSGVYFAYANHRPFTLSPDMIWLLISQGFANHVVNNADELRDLFVKHSGKAELIVQNNKIDLNNPESPWEEVFPEISKQIGARTGEELTNAVTANFTTTTPISKVASQITLMRAMSAFFNYNVMVIGCGIPSITLEGTTKDWENVLAKAKALRKYKLDWWIDALEPELKQFIAASKGKIDKNFWQGMFKIHEQGSCGKPTIIDGWIVKFYPYDKFGKRMDLKTAPTGISSSLPDEIVKVDLNYIYDNGSGRTTTTALELWAGFVGLDQDEKTLNLKPKIGWMIRKKDGPRQSMIDLFKKHLNDGEGIDISVNAIPPELFMVGPIKKLSIWFGNGITIPDAMAKVPINELRLRGSIEPKERDRIIAMFPKTRLYINGEAYHSDQPSYPKPAEAKLN